MAQRKQERTERIQFDHEGTTYVLEFDRATIREAERTFDVSFADIRGMKLSVLPDLFHAALLKHHPRISQANVDQLYALISDKAGLMRELTTMYIEGINSLMDEPEEGNALIWKRQ